ARAAPEPAGFLEIRLAKSAHWTLLGRGAFFNFLGSSDAEKQIGKCKAGRVLHAFFLRASIAEIHLLHFAFQYLCQEDCRIIAFANVAQHFFLLDPELRETFNPKSFPALSTPNRRRSILDKNWRTCLVRHRMKTRNRASRDWSWLAVPNQTPVGFDYRNNLRSGTS